MASYEMSSAWKPNSTNAQCWDTKGYNISYSLGDGGRLYAGIDEYSGCAKNNVGLDWFANQSIYKMKVFTCSNGKSYLIPGWLEKVANKVL